MVRVLLLALLFLPSYSSAEISPEEYLYEVEIHISTILDMSEYSWIWTPMIGYVDPYRLKQRLMVHDSPKSMPLDVLRMYNFQGEEPIFVTFARFFGRNFGSLNPDEQLELHNAKSELDRVESQIKVQIEEYLEMSGEELKRNKRIERILDITATGISRRKELVIKDTEPYYGERWFLARGMPVDAQVSKLIEDEFVRSLEYRAMWAATKRLTNCALALSGN